MEVSSYDGNIKVDFKYNVQKCGKITEEIKSLKPKRNIYKNKETKSLK